MKKIFLKLIPLLLFLSFLSCDGFTVNVFLFPDVSGKVIDAKLDSTDNGIANVTVNLVKDGQVVTSTTTDSTGEFTFSDVEGGEYTVTASKTKSGTTGYVFIEKKIRLATAAAIGDIIGFQYDTEKELYDLSFIVMWDQGFDDVDIHLTYPGNIDMSNITTTFTTPYDIPSTPAGLVPENDGVTSTRETVNWENPSNVAAASGATTKGSFDYDADGDGTNDSYKIELDVDDRDGKGPETITVKTFPYSYNNTDPSTSGGNKTGLTALSSGHYTWHGAMEVYLDAYDSDTVNTAATSDYLSTVNSGNGANAILYVLQGPDLLGVYTVPSYTKVEQASLIRINMFTETSDSTYEVFQIVPDIKIIATDADMKSVDAGPIVVRKPIK